MRVLRYVAFTAVMVLGLTIITMDKAHAYSYNAWVGLTGDKTIAINPFMYGNISPGSFGASFENVFEFGINKDTDFFISTGALNIAGGVFVPSWGMIRFGLGDPNQVIALKATTGFGDTNSGTGTFGPQYHGVFNFGDTFTLEANLWWDLSYKSLGDMTITAIVAPVVKFDKDASVAVFLEIDPVLTLAGGSSSFALNVVPGLSFLNGTITVGLTVNNITGSAITLGYGAWVWVPFSFGGSAE
ncbi:MAG: hypothetical protein A2014_11885 [Spirochaetes bacterium GWF1_49_6]|nr:MAG: hypothetical protein A2014_11885 [Spirochaetes bacterium GWF1_49_6]